MSWADSMSVICEALLTRFDDVIVFNGVTYECTATPLTISKRMTDNPYEAVSTVVFEMRESDRSRAGIVARETVTYEDPEFGKLVYTVYEVGPAKHISLTQLRCNLKQ